MSLITTPAADGGSGHIASSIGDRFRIQLAYPRERRCASYGLSYGQRFSIFLGVVIRGFYITILTLRNQGLIQARTNLGYCPIDATISLRIGRTLRR